jgi:hypothetical protein
MLWSKSLKNEVFTATINKSIRPTLKS